MRKRSLSPSAGRTLLRDRGCCKEGLSAPLRRLSIWKAAGGVVGATILMWGAVQGGQALSGGKGKQSPINQAASRSAPQAAVAGDSQEAGEVPHEQPAAAASEPLQGPALDVPQEVLEMLNLRKRDLDRREEAVRQNEERLLVLRNEVEKLLAKNEAVMKAIQTARAKSEEQAAGERTAKAKALLEKERLVQEQRAQLAKMFETMPSEDAAVRLEKMPDRAAVQILRLVKTKTAGAILAQVKPERAAKLTEQLLAPPP